ncbi:hypothetical protein MSPP1_003619 [Malassezia sp. CBS 17886]|nr:hypothetical protein MSPP1_003619 [Malassezia sp. CBS 17886]
MPDDKKDPPPARRRMTAPSARPPAPGRTTSMVPSRTGSAVGTPPPRAQTPQPPPPAAARIMFRPVMPPRRRAPSSAASPPPASAPLPPSRAPAHRAHRAHADMVATGPFALGPMDKQRRSSANAAHTPTVGPPPKPTAAYSLRQDEGDPDGDGAGIDMVHVSELDEAAPQTLLHPPQRVKEEHADTVPKTEGDSRAAGGAAVDVNPMQALDLSESEDEQDDDELAAQFVSTAEHGSSDGRLFLFQFPHTFPHFAAEPGPKRPETPEFELLDAEKPAAEAAPKCELPADAPADPPAQPSRTEGHVGRLDILRDGRLSLRLGDMPFDIAGGCETSFLQQLVRLNAERQQAQVLGEVEAKLVATPSLAYLLAHGRAEGEGGGRAGRGGGVAGRGEREGA